MERQEMIRKLFDDVNLEIQSNCNRACWFCPRPYDTSGVYFDKDGNRVIDSMPDEKINDILAQLESLSFTGRVCLNHLSEPALDRRLIDIAKDIRRRGMLPTINTNGDIFRKNEELSAEAAKIFHHIVVGIYDLMNSEEVEKEKQYWYNRLKGTNVFFSVIAPENSEDPKMTRAFPRTAVPASIAMTEEKKTFPHGKCHRPLERLIIKYNGSVALCCEDHMSSFNLGNVFETSIMDIYYSPRRLSIVESLIDGKRYLHTLCSRCSLPPTLAPKGINGEPLYRESY